MSDDRVTVIHGDCLDALARLGPASVDAVVTDPPYGFAFMGKAWDKGVPGVAYWRAVLRVLKPGGHLVAFGGPRTAHRLACAIEDAGFEIRDSILHQLAADARVAAFLDSLSDGQRDAFAAAVDGAGFGGWLAWVFGQGFPKSMDVAAARAGWGTALKPAQEPIVLARKPFPGTVAETVVRHGTGALNVDGCRIAAPGGSPAAQRRQAVRAGGDSPGRPGEYGDTLVNRISPERYAEARPGEALGRWPANLLHDGSPEVLAGYPVEAGAAAPVKGTEPSAPAVNVYSEYGRVPGVFHGDAGSAARFFYTAKATAADRFGTRHPTVKPIALMRWLVRLVTPPGGMVLDPFAGSGTTGAAALAEGCRALLIERDADSVADIRARLDHLAGAGPHSASATQRNRATPTADDLPIFRAAGSGGGDA